MGATKTKIRQQAEDHYIANITATFKEVAELYAVTEKTIGKWAKEDDWYNSRLEFHSSPIKIKQILQRDVLKVANGEAGSIKAKEIKELLDLIEKCDKRADPIVVHRILKDLDNFISEQDPTFAAKATAYHKLFLQHRISLEA
jgi:hypothetical protein